MKVQSILAWEPFHTIEEIKNTLIKLKSYPYRIALPFHYLETLSKEFSSSSLTFGATSLNDVRQGSFTETIAGRLLKEANSQFVLVGRCKSRKLNEDNNQVIRRKIAVVTEFEMTPILCIGDNLQQRESGQSQEILRQQLSEGLQECSEKEWKNLQILYEAPWINETPFLPDLNPLLLAYKECGSVIQNLFSRQPPLLCGLPNDIRDFSSLIDKMPCDGFYFGGTALNVEAISKGLTLIAPAPSTPEENPELLGEAVLEVARELDEESNKKENS